MKAGENTATSPSKTQKMPQPNLKKMNKLSNFFGEAIPTELVHAPRTSGNFSGCVPIYFKHATSHADCDVDTDADDDSRTNIFFLRSPNSFTSPAHGRKKSESDHDNLFVKMKCPDSATFDEMIDFFTAPDRSFSSNDLDAFIVCLPSFGDPLRLISALRARFNAVSENADSFTEASQVLELRLRQDKIIDFLNDWLRSACGMEDLRHCPNLHQTVRKFLENEEGNDVVGSMLSILN